MSGDGVMQYANGSVYNGHWKEDKRSGNGTIIHPTGSKYVGNWSDDLLHGDGTYMFANGDVYKGKLENGYFNGQGSMRYVNGAVYNGTWANDKKNGDGKLIYASGKTMEGEWQDDEFKRSVATRTRSHELPVHPFQIEPGRRIEDKVALETHKSPAALITLSDGFVYNIQTALGLNSRIQYQIQKGNPPSHLYNTLLSEEDVSRLNDFLTLLSGGKKRRKRRVI